MNKRTLSTIKGFVWTAFALLLLCTLLYCLSVLYLHRLPPTWATRLLFILPPVGALFGAVFGWVNFADSTEEKKKSVLSGIAYVLIYVLISEFWRWVFGAPRDEESKFVIQMLSILTTAAINFVWLLYLKRLGEHKAKQLSQTPEDPSHNNLATP